MSQVFAIDPDHPITKLDPARPAHWMIARLLAHGVTHDRIAKHIDCTEFTVKQYARDPRTQAMIDHLDDIKAEIDVLNEERFDDLQQKAIKQMEEAIDDPKLSTEAKLRLCKDILDRHPKGKFVKAQNNRVDSTQSVTNEVINELKRRSQMAAAEVIDITPQGHPNSPVPPAPGPDSLPPQYESGPDSEVTP